ncbi:hypothetical protein GGR54DRAFT_236354 [Hypoxylon sp. NC1633]|nr:hypothetical protein GGR54DRAFT_236354 [Hypoxylon sp. NC1633]
MRVLKSLSYWKTIKSTANRRKGDSVTLTNVTLLKRRQTELWKRSYEPANTAPAAAMTISGASDQRFFPGSRIRLIMSDNVPGSIQGRPWLGRTKAGGQSLQCPWSKCFPQLYVNSGSPCAATSFTDFRSLKL